MALTIHEYRRPRSKITFAERTYQRFFQVISDDISTGNLTVATGTGLPELGETFAYQGDTDTGVYCSELDVDGPDREGTRKKWYVTASYTSQPHQQSGSVGLDPLDEPAQISGSFSKLTRLAEFDKDGELLLNTAFERFRVEVDDSRINLVIRKNFSSVDFSTWADYRDAVNTDTFWYLGARKWKVENISPELARRGNGSIYFPVTMEFSCNPETWDYVGISEGYYRLLGPGRTVILDQDGQPLNAPVPLDVNGAPVDAGVSTIGTSSGQIYPITKRIYPERAFVGLGVPMNAAGL